MHLVVFALEQQRYALQLDAVERVVRAVEISPLPKAPEIVRGVVNVRGRVIPVINARRRFRLPEREDSLTDRFIIAHTSKRPVCLVADAIFAVEDYPQHSMAGADSVLPGLGYIKGVMKLKDGLAYIHDLDSFLSLEEEASLTQALR